MREFDITTRVIEMQYDELPHDDRRLIAAAREATYRAYAPYSHFHVGVAILLDDGDIIDGSNQENAAFPSGMCAERTACYYAHAMYPQKRFVAIAIAARGINGELLANPISPCGACRQALLEYERLAGQPMRVILSARDLAYIVASVHELLPLAFDDFQSAKLP